TGRGSYIMALPAALPIWLELFEADPLLLLPVRMTRRKRIELAIDALAELRRTHPRAALVVTGGPGAHNPTNVTYERELAARAGRSEEHTSELQSRVDLVC